MTPEEARAAVAADSALAGAKYVGGLARTL